MAKIFSIFFALVSSSQLSIVLIAVGTIFLIFIVIAVIKTFRLNAESKKLAEMDSKSEDDNNYKDFTDGHLYDNK